MGGSTSSKLSWHQDRARYKTSEDYEIPMSKRKYDDGGGVDDFKMSYDEMTTYEKSNHIHYNPMNSRWVVTKNGEHKEFWNQEQAEKYAGFEFENEKDARYSRKKYEALFGYSDGGELKVGDEICITGPTTGIIFSTISELREENKSVDFVKRGALFTIKTPEKIRPSDKLYKLVDA